MSLLVYFILNLETNESDDEFVLLNTYYIYIVAKCVCVCAIYDDNKNHELRLFYSSALKFLQTNHDKKEWKLKKMDYLSEVKNKRWFSESLMNYCNVSQIQFNNK